MVSFDLSFISMLNEEIVEDEGSNLGPRHSYSFDLSLARIEPTTERRKSSLGFNPSGGWESRGTNQNHRNLEVLDSIPPKSAHLLSLPVSCCSVLPYQPVMPKLLTPLPRVLGGTDQQLCSLVTTLQDAVSPDTL